MKMNLAVYTAQEGYAWQPGTVFTPEELQAFKRCIGRFPSADSTDFPFGGVFLLDDSVVFYRYHVAKKIDFRGRDALYCVLGAVSRAEAAKIDPAALFAMPEFSGPMKPFPVALDVPEADSGAVPEWLKNLDTKTLDVRITGSAENPSYAVSLNHPVEVSAPPAEVAETSAGMAACAQTAAEQDSATPTFASGGRVASPLATEDSAGRAHSPSRALPSWMIVGIAVLAVLSASLFAWAGWFFWKRHVRSQEPTPKDVPVQVATGKNVEPVLPDVKPAETNAEQSATNSVQSGSSSSTNAVKVAPSAPVAATNSVAVKATAAASTNAPAASPKPAAPMDQSKTPAVQQSPKSGK